MTTGRAYERTHPWISFRVDLHAAPLQVWTLLGQAVARCGQIAGSALPPGAAEEMQSLYLVKGVQATTAIEGNTLSTEQIRERIQGRLPLPPSQEYLGREVDNILEACGEIAEAIVDGIQVQLTAEWIATRNRQVLAGLEKHLEEGVVPGEIPAHAVGVGRYRGAPRADCAFLLERLCKWLAEEPGLSMFRQEDGNRIATAILHAVLAHLYIAWIHPFGDGNGRTARLVEFMLLARAGVPLTSAQILSNHYNLTRAEYYRQLDRSSRASGGHGDPIGFVLYALQGLVDGLEKQCDEIDAIQLSIVWKHFVLRSISAGATIAGTQPSPRNRPRADRSQAAGTARRAPATQSHRGRALRNQDRQDTDARHQLASRRATDREARWQVPGARGSHAELPPPAREGRAERSRRDRTRMMAPSGRRIPRACMPPSSVHATVLIVK